tara:strand:+ start:29086 stop:30276 length:1191 start_codon:yes stop_codon:yes gene_type:complete
MSQIKEFLNNKKENQMLFTVYTPDSKPEERIFKDFKEIEKYTGLKDAQQFLENGGVSFDGVVRLEAANTYTENLLKEEALIARHTYSNGEFNPNLLADFNKILEGTSPISERDYILLYNKAKDKIEKDGTTIFMVNYGDEEFIDFLKVDNLGDLRIRNIDVTEKKGGESLGAYHYEDTLSVYDHSLNKLFVVDLRGEAQSIKDILEREKIEGVSKIGVKEYHHYNEDDHRGYTTTNETLVFGSDEEVEKVFASFENKIEEINRLVNEGEIDDSGMYYYTSKDGFTHSQENPLHIEEAVQLFDEVKIYFPKDDPFGFIFAHEAEITKDTLIKAGSVNGNLYIEGTNGQVVEFKLGDKVELNENPKISNGLENNPNYEFQYSKRLDDPKPKSSRRPKM